MDSLSVKRRLTCILAADAVGYSSHMGHDEDGTIRVLAAHRAVIDGIIAFHEGRIIGTAGDSVLAEFASVVEAVRCAVEIQEALKTRNDSLPEGRRMYFRVGVNLGDVVVKDQDLLGDGVNVAARLETIAEPGGICISSSVYDQITGKLDLGFQDIGEQIPQEHLAADPCLSADGVDAADTGRSRRVFDRSGGARNDCVDASAQTGIVGNRRARRLRSGRARGGWSRGRRDGCDRGRAKAATSSGRSPAA